jgi:hypothetical protein
VRVDKWLEDKEYHSDPEPRLVSQYNPCVPLACPYYRSNPKRYRSCLLQYSLQTIEDVIRHLQRHHTKPPHCPMCFTPFDNCLARDKHIMLRTCTMRDSGEIDGISEYQKAQLVKRDRPDEEASRRWNRICTIVFSKPNLIGGPYLDQGREQSFQ